MRVIISLNSYTQHEKRKNTTCPFKRKCLLKGVSKEVITKGYESNVNIGSTGVQLLTRFNQHMQSFKPNNSKQTILSKYFKKFKDEKNMKIQSTILLRSNNDMPLRLK